MSELEGTPEDFAKLAAQARGQEVPDKRERDRALVESIHPAEPERERDTETEDFVTRLLAPRAAHAALIRGIHGVSDEPIETASPDFDSGVRTDDPG